MNKSLSFRGNLATIALPEVFTIVENLDTAGVLQVTRDGMVKRVHVEGAYVVHASSSDPIDRLSEHIRRSGLVDKARIEALDRERSNSSKRLGVLLIESRLLAPGDVYWAICGQIERIVWSLFAWQEGEVEFEPGGIQDGDAVRIKLPLRRVAFEGIKRSPRFDPEEDGAEGARRGGDRVLEPSFQLEDLIDIGVSRLEMELLELVDGHRSLDEICAESAFSPTETARRLYAFEVLSLVRAGRSGAGSLEEATSLPRGVSIQ